MKQSLRTLGEAISKSGPADLLAWLAVALISLGLFSPHLVPIARAASSLGGAAIFYDSNGVGSAYRVLTNTNDMRQTNAGTAPQSYARNKELWETNAAAAARLAGLELQTNFWNAAATNAANVGAGVGLYKDKTSGVLSFKSLLSANSYLTIADVGTTNAQFTFNVLDLVQTNRAITAGSGLLGGGNLSADRTLSLDWPTVKGTNDLFYAPITGIPVTALSTNGGTNGQVAKIVAGAVAWADDTGGAGGGEANDGANVGAGVGLYKDKTGVTLNFKSIVSSNAYIVISNVGDTNAQFTFNVLDLVQTNRAITAGSGLLGGGNLSADRTLSLNWPELAGTNDTRYPSIARVADVEGRTNDWNGYQGQISSATNRVAGLENKTNAWNGYQSQLDSATNRVQGLENQTNLWNAGVTNATNSAHLTASLSGRVLTFTIAPGSPLAALAINNFAGGTNLPLGGLAQSGATTGQVAKWNGSAWAPGDDNGGTGSSAPTASSDRNYIINPGFPFWQRGLCITNLGTNYVTDHVSVAQDGGTGRTSVWTRTELSQAERAIVTGATYCAKVDFLKTTGGAGPTHSQIRWPIENVQQFQGKICAFSFWAKAGANTNFYVFSKNNYGIGGSAADHDVATNYFSVTTAWQRFSGVFTNSTFAGLTMGAKSYKQIILAAGDATGNSVLTNAESLSVTAIQLEDGGAATQWLPPNPATDLVRCQRYYEKSYALDTKPGTVEMQNWEHFWSAGNSFVINGDIYGSFKFKVPKLYTPTVTIYSYNGATSKSSTFTTDFPANSGVPYNSGLNGAMLQNSSGFNITNAAYGINWHWTSESEF